MLNLKSISCFFILAIAVALAGNAYAEDGNTTTTSTSTTVATTTTMPGTSTTFPPTTTTWAVTTTEVVSTTQVNTSTSTTSSTTTSLITKIPASTTMKSSTSTTNGGGGASKTANTAVPLRTTTTLQKVTISTSGVAAGLSTQFVSTTEPDVNASTVLSTAPTYVPTTLAVFLVVEVISPLPGASASDVRDIRLRVRYSNDGLINDTSLNVAAGNERISLARIGDFFVGKYSPPGNLSDLNISVSDSLGYSGLADVKLIASHDLVDDGIVRAAGSLGLVAAGIFAVFVVPLILIRRFRGSKRDRSIEKGQYSEVKKVIDSMNKESEDDSISKWVFDKLSHGEDPEVLKKGLKEMGYDSKIVDKVLDSQ